MYMSSTLTRASLINLLLTTTARIAPASATLTTTTTTTTTSTYHTPRHFLHQATLPLHPHCSAIHLYNNTIPNNKYQSQQSTHYSTMSTSNEQQQTQQTQQQEQDQKEKPILALPDAESATKLDVSGDGSAVALDHLGPVVVNQDGTLSRISNWEAMTEIEKKNTLRVLGKRNKMRLEALKRERGEGN
ncbi:uncharacterized protein BO88DRAFT_401571 [Aspergillus vadensis CBS 113365]|uniref:Fungal specific transcription factor n=1 Tax=Aspergillus vadensis (strain CBS 113365 / IMI 142717 / IBT 24658) TaxID=1448311 RepID=A0A319C6H2_ASPVC|nr:hypothetical protein BO88DRAFT_401571 [Aspergillus vadensis CBS 113365]PYH73993.1 hypothetical protein BO88DRAFT_401571 [Aspergillus vadensis CBS 113365]